MKRVFALILCLTMIFSLVGCGSDTEKTVAAFDTEIESCSPDEWEVSNDNFTLVYDEIVREPGRLGEFVDKTVTLYNNETDESWSFAAVSEDDEDAVDPFTGMPLKRSSEASTALAIRYLDTDNNQDQNVTFSYNDANKNGRVCVYNVDNGFRFEYYFDAYEIMVPITFTLREDSVAISFDPSEIQEGDRYQLVDVRVAPFWCSAKNDDENSYLFFPSGSGAIIEPESLPQHIDYQAPVFGRDYVMLYENELTETEEVKIPVYGSKKGDLATCAIIEEGQGACSIGAKVGSQSAKFSTVYSIYQVRGYTENIAQEMNRGKTRMNVYSNYINPEKLTVGFYPLNGDKANYNGMAETYKNYLKNNGVILETKDDSPLNVTFIGGVVVNESFLGVPYKDLATATTLNQAQNILTEISKDTGAKISAKLLGFGASGIETGPYAGGLKLNGNLGSKKDLSKLSEFCRSNNVDLYYDFDIIKLKTKSAGYSTFFDIAHTAVDKAGISYDYHPSTRGYINESKHYLLSRELLKDGAGKVLDTVNDWDLGGVSLETLSYMSYSDYSVDENTYYGRGKTIHDVNEIVKMFHDNDYKFAATSANAYAAVASDIVYDAPTNSSREHIFSYDVPFYQMVFKGYVPMTAQSMNMATNPNTHLLRTVESGSGLHYTVINTYDNEFIDYDGYYFFGSEYNSIKNDISSTYAKLKDYYEAINGQEIVSHTVLDNGLRETEFSGGAKVYVNYTEADLKLDDTVVEAESFVFVE